MTTGLTQAERMALEQAIALIQAKRLREAVQAIRSVLESDEGKAT